MPDYAQIDREAGQILAQPQSRGQNSILRWLTSLAVQPLPIEVLRPTNWFIISFADFSAISFNPVDFIERQTQIHGLPAQKQTLGREPTLDLSALPGQIPHRFLPQPPEVHLAIALP